MGEVVATLKIMPESPDVDLEALKAAIQAAMTAHLLVQVGINFSQAKKNRYHWGVIADIKR